MSKEISDIVSALSSSSIPSELELALSLMRRRVGGLWMGGSGLVLRKIWSYHTVG